MFPAGRRPATSCVHYTTSCNTQSNAPEDGQNNCPKHVELAGIINKPLLLHLVGCLYYLYQWCKVKQISDNEIYLLIKYINSVLWRVAKFLSYIEEARCLKVKLVYKSILSKTPVMKNFIKSNEDFIIPAERHLTCQGQRLPRSATLLLMGGGWSVIHLHAWRRAVNGLERT